MDEVGSPAQGVTGAMDGLFALRVVVICRPPDRRVGSLKKGTTLRRGIKHNLMQLRRRDQPSRPAKPIRSGTLERFEPSPTAVSVVMGRLHTPPPQLISPGVIQLRQTPGSKPDSRGDAASRIGWPKQRRRSGRATQANAAACKALSARRAVRDFSSGLARLAGLGCLREGLFVLSELPGRLPAER